MICEANRLLATLLLNGGSARGGKKKGGKKGFPHFSSWPPTLAQFLSAQRSAHPQIERVSQSCALYCTHLEWANNLLIGVCVCACTYTTLLLRAAAASGAIEPIFQTYHQVAALMKQALFNTLFYQTFDLNNLWATNFCVILLCRKPQ